MTTELINIKTNEVILPSKIILPLEDSSYLPRETNKTSTTEFSRREFLVASLFASSLVLLPQRKAEAWLPIIAIVAGIVARSIITGVARVIGRSVATRVIGKTATSIGYASLSTKLQAAVIEEVVTDLADEGITNASKHVVHQLALDKPQALWAQGDKLNPFEVIAINKTDKQIETDFKLGVTPVNSYKAEMHKGFILKIPPFSKAKFEIDAFKDLPSTGIKRIVHNASTSKTGLQLDIGTGKSGSITVMKTNDIYI